MCDTFSDSNSSSTSVSTSNMTPFRGRPAPDDPLPTHDISKELEFDVDAEHAAPVLRHAPQDGLVSAGEKSGSATPDDSGSERGDASAANAERGHRDSDEKRESEKTWLLDRKEEVEITPVEAFGVDVSGEQSPCELGARRGGVSRR
jgi:hypothetical protein